MASTVEVVAIGNELLLGETADTNTSWLAQRLAREGIRVRRATLVPDDVAAIRAAIETALLRTHHVICTGGLGPTSDDLTRDVVAALYGREQHLDESWLAELRSRFERRRIPMPAINRVQALVPAGAVLLPNARGTAPGIILDDEALGVTILLPGVPSEMRGLMEQHVVPWLRDRFTGAGAIESRVLRTTGISEAALAERITDVVSDIAPLTIAYLPGLPGVDLRFTHWGGAAPAVADAVFDRVTGAVRARLGLHVYADADVDLAAITGDLLRERGLHVAIAESCTGGLLAKRLTDAAGASDFLIGAFVTYSNGAKREQLGVREETIALEGAVSEQCAREMAIGVQRVLETDVGISITGIAGPGGGSAEKPVGLVWFALALSDELAHELQIEPVTARSFVFPGERTEIRERAAQAALDMLRRTLQRVASAEPGHAPASR